MIVVHGIKAGDEAVIGTRALATRDLSLTPPSRKMQRRSSASVSMSLKSLRCAN